METWSCSERRICTLYAIHRSTARRKPKATNEKEEITELLMRLADSHMRFKASSRDGSVYRDLGPLLGWRSDGPFFRSLIAYFRLYSHTAQNSYKIFIFSDVLAFAYRNNIAAR